MKKPGGTGWIDNAQIYINMGSPWKNTHFLRFLHNEIQVIVTTEMPSVNSIHWVIFYIYQTSGTLNCFNLSISFLPYPRPKVKGT